MPSDLEGNLIDLYNRKLYSVVGTKPGEAGEWELEENTPFPSNYTWEDVEQLAGQVESPINVVSSENSRYINQHSPCFDVDQMIVQITSKMPDGRVYDGLTIPLKKNHSTMVSAGNLGQLMVDLKLVWNWTINQRQDLVLWFEAGTRIHVVPSSTPSHHHLYINAVMSWEEYEVMLAAFVEAGIVGDGYLYFCSKRKATWLRMPGISKRKLPGRNSEDTLTGGRIDSVRSVGGVELRRLAGIDTIAGAADPFNFDIPRARPNKPLRPKSGGGPLRNSNGRFTSQP